MKICGTMSVVLLNLATLARASDYSFTVVADTIDGYASFSFDPTAGPFDVLMPPAINNVGNVAFRAWLGNGTLGIFTGQNPDSDLVVDVSPGFHSLSVPTIIDDGSVYFAASLDPDHTQTGIFNGPDPVADVVVEDVYFSDGVLFAGPVVAGNGTIAHVTFNGDVFSRSVDGREAGIEIGDEFFSIHVDINSHGETVISGSGIDGNLRVYSDSGLGAELTATHTELGILELGGIDEDGYFFFDGISSDSLDGTRGLFIGSAEARPESAIDDTNGEFSGTSFLSWNNRRQAAFKSFDVENEIERLFVMDFSSVDNPTSNIVLTTGQDLFGSQLDWFRPSRINDAGQIAFTYELENGLQGVAVATPIPEPSCLALFMISAVLVATKCRRRTVPLKMRAVELTVFVK